MLKPGEPDFVSSLGYMDVHIKKPRTIEWKMMLEMEKMKLEKAHQMRLKSGPIIGPVAIGVPMSLKLLKGNCELLLVE